MLRNNIAYCLKSQCRQTKKNGLIVCAGFQAQEILARGCTTLMVRNLPNKLTPAMIVECINELGSALIAKSRNAANFGDELVSVLANLKLVMPNS